jgi:hypothetical protein
LAVIEVQWRRNRHRFGHDRPVAMVDAVQADEIGLDLDASSQRGAFAMKGRTPAIR